MKAIARRDQSGSYTHEVLMRDHDVTVDEPVAEGGYDEGPNPQELLAASLASCTAITMEMYAQRKGWDIGEVEVVVEYEAAPRGHATFFNLTLRFPEQVSADQQSRLEHIAAKCPVHRTLEGPVHFKQRVEQTSRR